MSLRRNAELPPLSGCFRLVRRSAFRCCAAYKGVGSLIQDFQPKEFVVVLNNIKSLDMYLNVQVVCGYLFIALPLSVKTGVLGRLLLLIPPPRINEYPPVIPV